VPPISILDVAPIVKGGTPADALHNSLDLAQHAERRGYRRFWLAEHNLSGAPALSKQLLLPAGCERPCRLDQDSALEGELLGC
jgi:hypothetical protein